MSMLGSLAVLIICQVGGEALHAALDIPVPGPVLGIGLLLLGLGAWARCAGSAPALPAADALLSYLALFFVPPGVSMLMQIGALGRLWPILILSLTASSILALIVTGRLTQFLLRNATTSDRARRAAMMS
jgi:holin-like protein